ncbi:MAG: hypothetical protein ABR577_14565 [Pyrinomonadaceae bacterium]
MNPRTLFAGLLAGLSVAVLTTIVSALIYTGFRGTVPRQVVAYGAIAGAITFVVYLITAGRKRRF